MKTFSVENLGMKSESFSILKKCAKRVFALRACALVEADADYTIRVSTDNTLSDDRYSISFSEKGAEIKAANDCAVHAAFGRFLLESVFDGRGDFKAPEQDIDFTPEKEIRGIYFATHFYNFYHMAPMEEVYNVIEDVALYGCNALRVWFDMHHYASAEDPEAKDMILRLRKILQYANQIGIAGSLAGLANEGYNSSPMALRAQWHKQGNYKKDLFHYHTEICPSKPGGLEEIIREKRTALEIFKDVGVRYISFGPYDQGGCTCPDCSPWGNVGYMKLIPAYKALVKEVMPEAELIVDTWKFDEFIDGEWEHFSTAVHTEMFDDVPYVGGYFPQGIVPECLHKTNVFDTVKFLEFSEISMYSCKPWGGFGASVLTKYMKNNNDKCSRLFKGGFCYSEGIYEDANKFIQLASYTGLYKNAFDALRAYVRTEFCCADEELYQAVVKTETGLARDYNPTAAPPRQSKIHDTSDVEFVYKTFQKYNEILPENITKSVKFRLFYLRSVIDYELTRNHFYVKGSPKCIEAMQEVDALYHVCEETGGSVRTPLDKEVYTELF